MLRPDEIAAIEEIRESEAQQKRLLCRVVSIDVAALHRKSSDPLLATKQSEKLGAIHALIAEVDSLNADVVAHEIKELTEQWKQLRKDARAAKDEMEKFHKPFVFTENIEREAHLNHGRAFAKYTEAVSSIPPVETYPTQEEYDEYDERVAKAEKALRQVDENIQAAESRKQGIAADFMEAKKVFDEIARREEALRTHIEQLSGKPLLPHPKAKVQKRRNSYGLETR